jgi:lipopolysaccharide assembly protein A
MRALVFVLVIAVLILGAVFGALNPQVVGYDFGFARFHFSKGSALLIALLIGWLLGGALCWAGSGLARQRKSTGRRTPRGEKA